MIPTKILTTRGAFIVIVMLLLSCGKSSDDPAPTPPVVTNDLSIDPAATHQTIAGFGGANQMWGTQFPSASDIKSAFGMGSNELGLSIFRIRISSNPDEWPLIVPVTKEAQTYGAKILASPWSPPPALKSNGSDIGGHLLEENYQAFVDHINDFITYMSSEGITIYAISIQNEPDIQVSYESCDWTAAQMKKFLQDYGDLITGAKVAAPESFNFNPTYTNSLLSDETSATHIDIVAGHIYGSGLGRFPLAEEKGKEIWMTEYLMNQSATSTWSQLSSSVIWEESLDMMETVHESMINNWNAYIWWYLKRYYSFIGDGTQGSTSGEVLKRGYAFSHFSKFVRPGYVRVNATLAKSGPLFSAYQGDGKTVIVFINQSTSTSSNINITVGSTILSSAMMYTTSLLLDREETEVTTNDGGKLLINVPGKSVVTVVIEN